VPGEILKKRREELGQDLKKIAHILKIRYDYLKAIEYLGINSEPIIEKYIQKTSPPVTEPVLPLKKEEPKKRKFQLPLIAIPALALVLIGVYISYPRKAEHKYSEKPKTASVQKTSSAKQTVQKTIVTGSTKDNTTKSEKQQTKKTKGYALEIRASETTWLKINVDNKQEKDLTLKQGESIKFSADKSFSLLIGNAGGIKLILDGKDIGNIGSMGEVVSVNLPSNQHTNNSNAN
jgi:cytoskeleton protein RodZ